MNQLKKERKFKWMALMLVIILTITPFFTHVERAAAASYPYLIKVNRQMCTVTIYGKDKNGKYTVPIKAMLCSPGWDTKIGVYKTPAKYRWHTLMGNVFGQYCTRINGGVLFHSVWYYAKDPKTLSNHQFNKLGTVCSHGCVRLNVEDAKWIYDNCPLGTTVEVYDSKNPGPLGKPESIKVSEASKMGYDPTDIWSEGNPYGNKKPAISGVKDQTLKFGASVDILKGVTAKDALGVDATKKITTTIQLGGKTVKSVDTKKGGKYTVTYKMTDALKRSDTKKAVFTVQGSNEKPKLSGVDQIIVKGGTNINHDLAVKKVTAKWGKETLSKDLIQTDIKRVKDKKEYSVTYKVTAPNNKTATAKSTIYIDNQAPEFSGVADKEISNDTVVDRAFALEGVEVNDEYTLIDKNQIEVAIKAVKEKNGYEVTYRAQDEVGNVNKVKVFFTIADALVIKGAQDVIISEGEEITEDYVLQGVKAYNGDTDITEQLKVTITETKTGVYTVIYSISDEEGHTLEKTVTFTVN